MAGEWEDVPVDNSGWEDVPQQAQVNEQPSVMQGVLNELFGGGELGRFSALFNPSEYFKSQETNLGGDIGVMNLPTGRFMNALSPFGWTAPAQAASGLAAGFNPSLGGNFLDRVSAGESAAKQSIQDYRNSPEYSFTESLPTDIALGAGIAKGAEGVASGLPFFEKFLGNAPAAVTFLGREAQRMGQGAFGGGLFGGLEAAGHDQNIPLGAASGMAFGGILGPLIGGVGEGLIRLKDKLTGITPAMKRLAELTNQAGYTKEESLANLGKAQTISGDKAVVADINPIMQEHLGASLAQSPLKPASRAVAQALDERAQNISKSVMSNIDKIAGTSPEKTALLAANMEALRAEANPLFQQVGKTFVGIDSTGRNLANKMTQADYGNIRKILIRKNVAAEGDLPERLKDFTKQELVTPFGFWDEARKYFNGKYQETFKASGQGHGFDVLSKEIQKYAKTLGDSSGLPYSDLLKRYGDELTNQKALEMGRNIFKYSPREINKFINMNSGLDKEYLKQGVREAVEGKMGSVMTGTPSEIKTLMSRQKTRDLFSFISDNPEQSRGLADMMHEAAKSLRTSSQATAGVEAGTASKAFQTYNQPATGPVTELAKANTLNAARQLVANVSKGGNEAKMNQMADEMIDFLSKSGSDAPRAIERLHAVADKLKGREKVNANRFLQVLSGKMATQLQQNLAPDNNNGK